MPSDDSRIILPPAPYIHPPRRWIIDQVLPIGQVCLLVGPAGVGKTTYSFDICDDVQEGRMIYGRAVNKTGVVIVSCDRDDDSHYDRLTSLGIPHHRFPFFPQRDKPTSIGIIIRACAAQFPWCKLLFIDGFGTLVPDGKLNDYGVVSRHLADAGALCKHFDLSILGSIHTAKAKEGEAYTSPREQALGSAAWAGFADLMIVMQRDNPKEPADPIRRVHVCTRGAAGDFTLKYKADKELGGKLVPYEDPIEQDLLSLMDYWLRQQPFERIIPTREFIETGKGHTISQSLVEKWLAKQLAEGVVTRPAKGRYQRVQIQ